MKNSKNIVTGLDTENQTSLTEREIQRVEVDHLRKAGFTVKVTSNNRRTANSRGTADTFVNIKSFIWIALEFKAERGGHVTEEQQRQIDAGMTKIISKRDEAVEYCIRLRTNLSLDILKSI